MSERKRPAHNYSPDAKRLCLSLIGVGEHGEELLKQTTAVDISQQSTAPSRRSLQYWKKAAMIPLEARIPPKKRGRKQKLSSGEEMIVAGHVLERVSNNQLAQAKDIIDFVAESFQEDISPSYVTRMMNRIHFSSHLIKEKEYRRVRRGLSERLLHFLLDFRRTTEEGVEPSQIVAVDIAKFSHYSHTLRSYAPTGG